MISKKDKTELLQIEKDLVKISNRLWNISKKNAVNNLGFETIQNIGNQCQNHASLIGCVVDNDGRK
jgi:hypothetical protein